MTTTPNDQPDQNQLKQNLLTAARNLRDFQLAWIRSAQKIDALETKKNQAETHLEDTELELAEADAVFATTRLKVLRLIREKRRLDMINLDLYLNRGNPRNDLWRTCATGSDDEIMEAAIKLGEHDLPLWENGQLLTKAQYDLPAAHEELAAASVVRRAAVQKRGKAKAALQAATEALQAAQNEQPIESCAFFELESKVVHAAAAITGTGDKQYAFSYVYTKDLGITGPGLEIPGEQWSIEKQARYRETSGYGSKPAPSREEE